MSFTIAGLAILAVNAAAELIRNNQDAINSFLRENRTTIHVIAKQSKPAIVELSKNISDKTNKAYNHVTYKEIGWEKKK